MPTYQIFDSLDRPSSRRAASAQELWHRCDELNAETENDRPRLTYAIGQVSPDGNVTFDF